MLKLLTPCRLGALELRNRIVMAPLTRCRADNDGFVPTDQMARYYAQRASAGLIVSEGAIVSPQGRGYPFTPGIWSEAQVAGWRKVTDAVHAEGGLIVCQLWHCGRLSVPAYHQGEPPVAPSAINPNWEMFTPQGLAKTVTPHALTRADIAGIVADFARGAAHARAAGFDGVEIHSSNGYLFHQFFSSCSNVRDDEYGGSPENRRRFLLETLAAVREVWPERLPLTARFGVTWPTLPPGLPPLPPPSHAWPARPACSTRKALRHDDNRPDARAPRQGRR